MKRVVLIIVPALICGMFLTNCGSPQDGELYVTGNDIISYNVSTGEIVFAKSKLDEIKSRLGLWSQLKFLIGDKSVFEPAIWIHSPLSSAGADDLHLRFSDPDFNKVYFAEFYQSWEWLSETERAIKQKEQEETHKKRKKELDFLIKFLNDAGKVVE